MKEERNKAIIPTELSEIIQLERETVGVEWIVGRRERADGGKRLKKRRRGGGRSALHSPGRRWRGERGVEGEQGLREERRRSSDIRK